MASCTICKQSIRMIKANTQAKAHVDSKHSNKKFEVTLKLNSLLEFNSCQTSDKCSLSQLIPIFKLFQECFPGFTA